MQYSSRFFEIPFYDHSHKMLSYKGNNVTFPYFSYGLSICPWVLYVCLWCNNKNKIEKHFIVICSLAKQMSMMDIFPPTYMIKGKSLIYYICPPYHPFISYLSSNNNNRSMINNHYLWISLNAFSSIYSFCLLRLHT